MSSVTIVVYGIGTIEMTQAKNSFLFFTLGTLKKFRLQRNLRKSLSWIGKNLGSWDKALKGHFARLPLKVAASFVIVECNEVALELVTDSLGRKLLITTVL